MRKDSLGLFWQDVDDKTQKKIDLLHKFDWIEVISGYWCEKTIFDEGMDYLQYSKKLDEAYLELKGKNAEKRTPPEPVWLLPSYLPYLEESRQFNINLFTDAELADAALEFILTGVKHKLMFDIECYANYFQIAFISITTGKVVYLEMYETENGIPVELNIPKLNWIIANFCIVGFNSNGYDQPIMTLALANKTNMQLKEATRSIIEWRERPSNVLRAHKVKKLQGIDHIDLIEVAPLFASLKIYGGRLHCQRMQDLPFHPDTVLTEDQIAIVRWYCINDLNVTALLNDSLLKQINLRITMGQEYGMDLRSKSDAQIAEAVIAEEVTKLNRCRVHRPKIDPGTMYKYSVPQFIKYKSPLMNWALEIVRNVNFEVSEHGSIGMPDELKQLEITIANATYKMGIGGLHSTEKKTAHYADEHYILLEKDVVSYYPWIILNQGLFPQHLGPNFLIIYRAIVERRLQAKKEGNKTVADSLKITINGSFGKLGSKYSILYAPDLLIQVTITGQLALLMLIEKLELAGIQVVSANTDGIVIKCHRSKEQLMEQLCKEWEQETQFQLDSTYYKALFSRDVNNYIALKDNSEVKDLAKRFKVKGALSRPGLQKNPTNEICIDAIEAILLDSVPIEHTITNCKDITKFVNVRTVKGGAVKVYETVNTCPAHETKEDLLTSHGYHKYYNKTWIKDNQEGMSAVKLDDAYRSIKASYNIPTKSEFLGKAIRWYYAKGMPGELVYAKSGNKVPRSDGAKPMMDIPTVFPNDVDYNWYIEETNKILKQIGYYT